MYTILLIKQHCLQSSLILTLDEVQDKPNPLYTPSFAWQHPMQPDTTHCLYYAKLIQQSMKINWSSVHILLNKLFTVKPICYIRLHTVINLSISPNLASLTYFGFVLEFIKGTLITKYIKHKSAVNGNSHKDKYNQNSESRSTRKVRKPVSYIPWHDFFRPHPRTLHTQK